MGKTQQEIDEEYDEAGMPLPAFGCFVTPKGTYYRCRTCLKKYKTLKGMRAHYFKGCGRDRNSRKQ